MTSNIKATPKPKCFLTYIYAYIVYNSHLFGHTDHTILEDSMAAKIAIVYGATGLIGKHLVTKLLLNDAYEKVYVVARRPISRSHPKLAVIQLPGERLSELNLDLKDHDIDAFSAMGTTIKQAGSKEEFRKIDFEFNLNFATACRKMGVRHFLLVSALGASSKSLVFYSRVKGELEDALRNLNFPQLTIAQPSLLLGERDHYRRGEVIASKFSPLLVGPLAAFKAIKAESVAAALIRFALATAGHGVTFVRSQDLAETT